MVDDGGGERILAGARHALSAAKPASRGGGRVEGERGVEVSETAKAQTPRLKRRAPKIERPASRSADMTRRALIDAAITVFAEQGFEAGSVRAITAKAKVNQGAITYHFGGKEELYREVLKTVRDFLSDQPLVDLAAVERLDPRHALKLFLRQTLAPLAETVKVKRYLRVYAWEQLKPTLIREQLSTEQAFPLVTLARRIVEAFLPQADTTRIHIATAWLLGQTFTFIRDLDWLSRPPLDLRLDKPSLDGLVEVLTSLCLGGLAQEDKALRDGLEDDRREDRMTSRVGHPGED
jgi:AcrR family transcriptional regulator